jgi:hypothetical protein
MAVFHVTGRVSRPIFSLAIFVRRFYHTGTIGVLDVDFPPRQLRTCYACLARQSGGGLAASQG